MTHFAELEKKYHLFFKVTLNSARCLKCHDVVVSKTRHDFVSCKCGAIFVDGGTDYLRAGAQDFKDFQSLSTSRPMSLEEVNERIEYYKQKDYTKYMLEDALEFRKTLYGE